MVEKFKVEKEVRKPEKSGSRMGMPAFGLLILGKPGMDKGRRSCATFVRIFEEEIYAFALRSLTSSIIR